MIMRREVLTIIPARGGSKRIPGKNIMPFAGKPLIAWTIEASRMARGVTRTVVSTDDHLIAQISRGYGAEVIDRPAEICGPTASSELALKHVLGNLRETGGYEPDLVVFLQATSPLRAAGDIDRAIEQLLAENADSLVSAAPVAGPGFLWEAGGGPAQARAVNYDPKNRPRTQDMNGKLCAENGSIYIFRPWVLEQENCRLGGKISLFCQPLEFSFEIDNAHDFLIMEQLAKVVR